MKKKFYITTSIAYTNALPHLGYALELVQADVLARYRRILGEDVFFLIGTDEHGKKVAKAAEKAGKTTEEFTDEISGKFRELTKTLNLSNDDFIRTTDKKRHWPNVEKLWKELKENGDIYKKKYQGLYCVGCEAFVKEKDLVDGKCLIHLKEPELIEEENYFFKLSKYADKVKKAIETDKIKITPESRKNEILSFIDQGIEDTSCSRSKENLQWGIPVPGDTSQTIYIWFEALINYLFPEKYWPADIHCVGKDIFRFHALLWPAMLIASGRPLPKNILVHGFITVAGQKMSKSLGNVIDPFELVRKYGTDPVRYFLLREILPTEDGDYTEEKFIERYNADLANGLGNLVARVITMAKNSNFQFSISNKFSDSNFQKLAKEAERRYEESLKEFKFSETLMAIWELIGFCDKYIEEKKPWSLDLARDKQEKIIGNLLLTIKEIAELLKPFLPETSDKILEQITLRRGSGQEKSEPLFPRLDKNA